MTFGDTLFHLGEVSRADAGHGRRVRLMCPTLPAVAAPEGARPGLGRPGARPALDAVRPDRRRRPRGRPLHRSAPADRLHRRARRATARSPASTCAAPRPGTRETELLAPVNAVEKVHAVVARRRQRLRPRRRRRRDALARRARHRRRRSARSAPTARQADRVPIVPAAILFDLWVGDARSAPTPPPATPPAQRRRATRRPKATSAPAPAPRSASCSASSGR